MCLAAYERWSENLEKRAMSLKRCTRQQLVVHAIESHYTVHTFLPQYGVTVGQLAYYSLFPTGSLTVSEYF
jgi:hypothetical protein